MVKFKKVGFRVSTTSCFSKNITAFIYYILLPLAFLHLYIVAIFIINRIFYRDSAKLLYCIANSTSPGL